MYKLVTGRLPYQATSQVNLIYQILNRPPPPPRTLRPELPPLLDTIIMHAMAKSRENRYQSWIEFGRDLTKAFSALQLSGETISDSQKFHELRSLDFFRYFTDAELWETLRIGVWRILPAGDVIIREGEQGESFFILVSGEVDVTLRGKPLSAINRGGCFGEIPYMSERVRQRATTIRAQSPVAALEIKGSAINKATEACQVQFNKALIQVLIERLDYANALLAER
jgi:CRP-like cAMP-binding protein